MGDKKDEIDAVWIKKQKIKWGKRRTVKGFL